MQESTVRGTSSLMALDYSDHNITYIFNCVEQQQQYLRSHKKTSRTHTALAC